MTPEKRRDFERQWPTLARRVEGMLVRKGVPSCRRDDILQETALRLIRVWDNVDPLKSVPGLATTIALNLVRDESRRRTAHDDLTELSDVSEPGYVEAAGLARVELGRVRTAMTELSPAQRQALLAEVGSGNGNGHGANAEKMLRLRARKKLMAAMERVSGAVLLRLRRTNDVFQLSTSGLRDAFVQGVSCLSCVALGLMVGLNGRLVTPAEAATKPNVDGARGSLSRNMAADQHLSGTARPQERPKSASTVRNRVVKPSKNAPKMPRSTRPRVSGPNAPKPGAPDEPGQPDLPVEVPDTGVEPPGTLPEAPDPSLPEPNVPAPAPVPVPAPNPPENEGVEHVVDGLPINVRLPGRN